MTISLERYSHLVGAIYDAALDASQWDAVVGEIIRLMGGVGGALLLCGPETRRVLNVSDIGMDAPQVKSYNDYYGGLDPIVRALQNAEDGTILPHHAVIAPAQAHKTEFYNDFALPLEAGDGMAVRVSVDNGNVAWLNVCAPLRNSPFATEERIAVLRMLLPHLQRSLRVQELLDGLTLQRGRARAALDRLEHAVVLVGQTGAVLFANAAASTLLQSADAIAIARDGALHAGRSDADNHLQRSIAEATDTTRTLPQAGSLLVERPSGASPFALHVLPLASGDAPSSVQGAAAMIVIVDTQRKPATVPESLRRLYRLTQAEARIAACVLHGESLQLIAEHLEITLSTVRIHLQRVFEKTGTHRQADLVRLLMRLQAGLDEPGIGLPVVASA